MDAVRLQPTFRLPASSRKIEEYENKVGYSERNPDNHRTPSLRPMVCQDERIAKPAHAAVMDDNIRFYPREIQNTIATTGWKA